MRFILIKWQPKTITGISIVAIMRTFVVRFVDKMHRILFVLLSATGFQAQAQLFTVTGTVRDVETGKALSSVTARLQSLSDSTGKQTTLTDSLGNFSFQHLPADSFRLTLSMVGFEVAERTIRKLTADVEIGTITLVSSSSSLGGVVVTGRIPPVTQKDDTLQYNASQFKVTRDASAEEMVKKMPGITVENGVVKAQGEDVQKVTLDGRELFGDDAIAALRNLPAEVIDKIQVFDRLSDQAQFTGVDDGNTTKSINIITKSGMQNGQFGRLFAGYGSDDRYSAGGNTTFLKDKRRISIVGNFNNINEQNFAAQDLLGLTGPASSRGGGMRGGGNTRGGNRGGGGGRGGSGNAQNFLVRQQDGISTTNAFGVNFSDVWGTRTTVSASYFFNQSKNISDELTNRRYYIDTLANFTQSEMDVSNNYNHRFNMRLEHKIDSNNSLLFTPSIRFQRNTSEENSLTRFYNVKQNPISITRNENSNKRDAINIDNNLLYRHSFAKRGRTFSVNLTTSYNNRNGESFTDYIDTSFTGGTFEDSASGRFTDQFNYGYRLAANLIYTEPVGKQGQFQFNYNPSYNRSAADQQTLQQDVNDGKYSIFNPDFSSKFDNNTTAQNGGITYRYTVAKGQLSVGANYQQTHLFSDQEFPRVLTVNKTFSNVLPNVFFRWKFNEKNNIRLNYRTSTNQPSVTQLQDVYDLTRVPFISAGNPQLEQEFSQRITARYTYTNTAKGFLLVANVYLQDIQNHITNATWVALKDSVISPSLTLKRGQQLTQPVNLDGYKSLRTFLTLALPLRFIKSNLNVNGGYTYSRLPGLINGTAGLSHNSAFSIGGVISSNISEYVDYNVSYTANFNKVKNDLQPMASDKYFSHTAAVQLILLSKTGWFVQNDLTNMLYEGLSAGFNQNYTLWNISAGKKFLKNQAAELRFTVFDVLQQNRSIERDIEENYIEDEQSRVLQQYFLVTLSYNLRNFGKPAPRGGGRR